MKDFDGREESGYAGFFCEDFRINLQNRFN